ncbi:MAG: hypothetical protein ABFC78_03825 [Methanoregula sp.]
MRKKGGVSGSVRETLALPPAAVPAKCVCAGLVVVGRTRGRFSTGPVVRRWY